MKPLDGIQLESPFFLRNLLVYPLSGGNGSDFVTLDEAMDRGWAQLEDPGTVERTVLRYDGQDPMFLMDGEEVVGALQNRVMNTSVLVGENSIVELPVSCAEEGRFVGEGNFRTGLSAAFPSLRAILADSVTHSLSSGTGYSSDQKKIWDSIRGTLTGLKVDSKTRSMHDAFDTLQDEIHRYTEGMDSDGRYSGFIGVVKDRVLGMDYFGSRSLFGKLRDKLILSYGVEALGAAEEGGTRMDDEQVKKFLSGVKNLEFERFKAVGRGTEYRARTRSLVSAALEDEGGLIHLAAFPKP
jgi:hypothetical protein